jgi:hypothetical protein
MPYFVYKVFPNRTVDFIDQFEKYQDAKKLTRQLRKEIAEEDVHTFRLVHAKHEREAERLLTTKREARPLGEE